MTPDISSISNVETEPGSAYEPAETFQISSLDQLKAISDPLRMEILEAVGLQALSVIQIAKRLNQPPTRLYYHVNALEEGGFLTVVDSRIHSGITEKYYRITAHKFNVARNLLNASPTDDSGFETVLSILLDRTAEELRQSHQAGLLFLSSIETAPDQNTFLSHITGDLPKTKLPELIQRIQQLIDDMMVDCKGVETVNFGFTVAFYPRENPKK